MAFSLQAKKGETPLDADAIRDILRLQNEVPIFKVAVKTFLSMTLCGPFKFSIPRLGIQTNGVDMEHIIAGHWMPFLRKQFIWIISFGVCPFYFKDRTKDHPKPVVPDPEMGYITVSMEKKGQLKYRWYWLLEGKPEEDKSMMWLTSEFSPTLYGKIRSEMASILPQWRRLLAMYDDEQAARTGGAHPTHLFEHHPPANQSADDKLVHLKAQFGQRVAGTTLDNQLNDEQYRVKVKAKHLMSMLDSRDRNNSIYKRKLLWSDQPSNVLPSFAQTAVPLAKDYRYQSASKPTFIGNIKETETRFNVEIAALIGFSLELIQPIGSARSQKIHGSERFMNEMVKTAVERFRRVAHAVLVVAYRRHFEQSRDNARQFYISRYGKDPFELATMMPELDVKIHMACTPLVPYERFQQMYNIGLIDGKTFALHVAYLHAMNPKEMQDPDKEKEEKRPRLASQPMLDVAPLKKRKPDLTT